MKGQTHTHTHFLVVKTLLPFRVEIHQPGHIVTDTSFQYNAVFIRMPMEEGQGGRKTISLNLQIIESNSKVYLQWMKYLYLL